MNCRHCHTPLDLTLVDLGSAPPSNSYLTAEMLKAPEQWFPLKALVCRSCWLVQTEDYPHAPFDAEYAYFSGFSTTWLSHCERYVDDMIERFGLGPESHVVEIASNDGYLLQFVKARGIPCTGIEPTASTAAAARQKGITVVEDFFGARLARQLVASGMHADLTAANNVLGHVPDINEFVNGFTILLAPGGVATFEFPHLLNLIEQSQFDTIYFEHYSYLSFTAVHHILSTNGLTLFDVEEYPTHGGSLRLYAQRGDTGKRPVSPNVKAMLAREEKTGMTTAEYYRGFQPKVDRIKNDFTRFLIEAKSQGKKVGAYGAAAKGNSLMNYAGVKPDLLPYVVDKNPAKQGKFMPGSRVPIVTEDRLRADKPDFVVIFPWNLKAEVSSQLEYVREWGGKLVTAIPRLEIM